MRVLQLLQKPQRRGAEVFAHQLSRELREQGHEVRTAYLYESEDETALPRHGRDEVLGRSERHFSERFPGANPRLLRRLLGVIDAFAPDVVQLNGARTVKYGSLARRLRPRGSWRAVYRNIGNPGDWDRSRPKRLVVTGLMSGMDGVVALSDGALRALRERYGLRAPAVVIPNGIDPAVLRATRSRQEVRAELRTPGDTAVILGVGTLSREKRFDLLLDAFAALGPEQPGAVLWVVGGGPLEPELRARAARLGVAERVRFTGVRPDVGSLMAAADVFALTSDTEGIPAVILEAGYHGLPVVATRVGGLPDCVVDGETGLLVPPGRADACAAALRGLLREPARRAEMGAAARALVARRFTMDIVAGQYTEFFRGLLGGRAG
jgi:glycosyltransferase involved in cell wall biosynthesis